MLKFKLQRMYQDSEMTLGRLTVDTLPAWEGYTVERPWLKNRPYVSCIPAGIYKAFTRVSPSNGKVIELEGVPDRTFIQFHIANWAWQLEGCIGVGWERLADGVTKSEPAMTDLYTLAQGQEIEVEILNPPFLPQRRGDEIGPAAPVQPKEISTLEPEMPPEWKQPVQYKKALASFIKKLERDIKRKQVIGSVVSLAGVILAVRYPIIHVVKKGASIISYFPKIWATLGFLYKLITLKQEADMTTLKWIKKRLKEPSTWAGVVLLAGAGGFVISPELVEAISVGVAGIFGVILIILKERNKSKDEEE